VFNEYTPYLKEIPKLKIHLPKFKFKNILYFSAHKPAKALW
jgi:hypothetical protein